MKKAFTLIELIITIVILAILMGVLFRIFIMISHIAVRIQYERGLHDEVIYVVQTIQNIVDQGDTSFFGDPNEANDGYSNTLILTGTDFRYTFNRDVSSEVLELTLRDVNGLETDYQLTNEARVKVKDFYIKRIPFQNQDTYENQMHEGFWLFMDVEAPDYDEDKRRFRVDRDIQTFFNIRKYD